MKMGVLASLWKYRACFIPPLSVVAAFALLAALAAVLGKVHLTKIQFVAIDGFPGKMATDQLHAVVSIGLSWAFSLYLFWLVAILGSVGCLYIVWRSVSDEEPAFKRAACAVLAAAVLCAVVTCIVIGYSSTLVSLQNVIRHLKSLSPGFWTMLELTNGLGIVTIVMLVISAGICLGPARSREGVLEQMHHLNVLLYVGAAIVVAWVLQSRLVYGLAATGLVEEQRKYVEGIAPTVTLVVGAVSSFYLILTYLSSFLVIQHRYSKFKEAPGNTRPSGKPKPDQGPMAFLFSTWSRPITFLVPILPAAFEFFFNFVEKLMKAGAG